MIFCRFVFNSYIGINDFERECRQRIDIYIKIDHHAKGLSSMDIKRNCFNYFESARPLLLEKAALDIVRILFDSSKKVSFIDMTIRKPFALKEARCSFVTIEALRKEHHGE